MKKCIIFIIILTCFFVSCQCNINKKRLLKKETEILDSLDDLITNNRGKNKLIDKVIKDISYRLSNKELGFSFNYKLPTKISGCAQFGFYDKVNYTSPAIIRNPYLINLYKSHPSLVYSIYIHEFYHAYSYFQNPNHFTKTLNNKVEKYLYEIDAHYVQAQFILDYTSDKNHHLSKYEEFLVNSMVNDDLRSFSSKLLGIDMNLIYDIYSLLDLSFTLNKKIYNIYKIGEEILNTFNIQNEASDEAKYLSVVPIITFIIYVPQLVYDIENNIKNFTISRTNYNFEKFSNLYNVWQEMKVQVKPYIKYYDYKKKITENFNKL